MNPTPRSYPRDLVVKTRRINYDPVMELYYYKSIRCRIREQKSLQESMGAWGSESSRRILINLSSRLCGIFWSYPQALFEKVTEASKPSEATLPMRFHDRWLRPSLVRRAGLDYYEYVHVWIKLSQPRLEHVCLPCSPFEAPIHEQKHGASGKRMGVRMVQRTSPLTMTMSKRRLGLRCGHALQTCVVVLQVLSACLLGDDVSYQTGSMQSLIGVAL